MGLVKGVGFDSWRRVGPLLPAARVYDVRDVDELVLFDIEATGQGRLIGEDVVKQVAASTSVPLSVGGGVSSVADVERLFDAGADRIVLNSFAYRQPPLIERLASRFGSQSVVVSVDARRVESAWTCWSECGGRNEALLVRDWAVRVAELGAGEILLTSIDHEGRMQGYAVDLLSEVSAAVPIPVIASGGAGCPSDACDAVVLGGASAVAMGSLFHFTHVTPNDIKTALASSGVAVRRPDLARLRETEGPDSA